MRIQDYINQNSSYFNHVERVKQQANDSNKKSNQVGTKSFEDVFKGHMETNDISFSKHAQQRLSQRDIELSENDIQKLNMAVKKAEEKGVDNTLVLSEKGAFIVNVSNNIVITAMAGNDMKDNIFTQIDGAVII